MKAVYIMIKRIVSVALILCLTLVIYAPAQGAMSLSNFDRTRTYRGGFTDVHESAWYYNAVVSAYERGIMSGRGSGIFDPSGSLTIAEAVKIAASLNKGFYTGSMEFERGSPWYAPYLEYALENGIPAGAYRNLNAPATRSDFALLIAGALPEEALTPQNRILDGAIPDVWESFSYGQAVYRLYRAGVLAGADREGRFFPGRTLTRAEAATIINRTVDANARASFSLAAPLTAEEIYRLASPAVFFVEVFDADGERIKTGSGFFISETGHAITNYHVIIGGTTMRITTDDGSVLDVDGVYDFDRRTDSALIQVSGGPFPYLELADSSRLMTGATVFALGSPLGLQASFSRGIVSQAVRELIGMQFIQLDAAISSGSSGGALLDTTGRVVGVTTATMLGGQNINLAIPSNSFAVLSREAHVPLRSIIIPAVSYEDYYPAPDFGAFYGVEPIRTDPSLGGSLFSYSVSDILNSVDRYVSMDDIIDEYVHLVEQRLFYDNGTMTISRIPYRYYHNPRYNVTLVFGLDEVNGIETFTVIVS